MHRAFLRQFRPCRFVGLHVPVGVRGEIKKRSLSERGKEIERQKVSKKRKKEKGDVDREMKKKRNYLGMVAERIQK